MSGPVKASRGWWKSGTNLRLKRTSENFVESNGGRQNGIPPLAGNRVGTDCTNKSGNTGIDSRLLHVLEAGVFYFYTTY